MSHFIREGCSYRNHLHRWNETYYYTWTYNTSENYVVLEKKQSVFKESSSFNFLFITSWGWFHAVLRSRVHPRPAT